MRVRVRVRVLEGIGPWWVGIQPRFGVRVRIRVRVRVIGVRVTVRMGFTLGLFLNPLVLPILIEWAQEELCLAAIATMSWG